ncbi:MULTISPECIES: LPS-assembly protein LptD [Inquilinus]|uniref:LPS-assembly protein LptD n=1 Tax=Inquilinus ginsengisoli TaxID=363840 RepID=A0ABU1JL99_9PROT|nr:LPS assembly protein LptD [Inquilinus ginsengisoli]MDR6288794.1 LPS-assembly protein [Inquilinus ginsengisoli]
MKRINRLSSFLSAVSVLAVLTAVGASAQEQQPPAAPGAPEPPAPEQKPAAPAGEPPVVIADELIYDQTLGLVTARGKVEINQNNQILRADQVTYNQKTQIVAASGHVALVQPGGEVMLGDYAELTDDMKDGFIQQVSLILSDNSRMIGNSAVRERGEITTIDRALYSPCNLCKDDPTAPPLWQIRAIRVTSDAVSKDIIFHDAFIDLFGVPLFYSPYFSMPDPSVDRRQGFLFPSFGSTSDVGPFFGLQYYFDISPDQDATVGATLTRDSGTLFTGEYRKRFDKGLITLNGSINQSGYSKILNDNSGPNGSNLDFRSQQLRWHFFGTAAYDFDQNWRFGVNVNRTSDRTYIDNFNISGADILQSRAFAEGFYGLNYIGVEALDWQDLRTPGTGVGSKGFSPTILPSVTANYVSEPNTILGGQWFANASAVSLLRDFDAVTSDPNRGIDTRRLSTQAGWQREFYSDSGIVLSARTYLRADVYQSDDVPDGTLVVNGGPDEVLTKNGVAATRLFPVATATARYPFVGQLGSYQQMLEPIVSLSVAPHVSNGDKIPNNDSSDIEFDEINLFSESRFPGLDRVEGGQHVSYGFRYGLYGVDGTSATFFLGQSYRFETDDDFPESSGLRDQLSDYVGRVTVHPGPYLNLDWRFRLDKDNFYSRRQYVQATTTGPDWLNLNVNYSLLDDKGEDDEGNSFNQQQLGAGAKAQITDFWSLSTGMTYDIENMRPFRYNLGAQYMDECFTFGVNVQRQFTTAEDQKEGYSFFLTLNLKNLGEVPLKFSADQSRTPGT